MQASKPDLVVSLKESGRSGTDGIARQYLRSVLVTLQIAMSLVLLVGAGLMINSFIRVQKNALGADARNVLTFDFRFAQNDTIKPYGRYRGLGLWDVMPLPALTFDRVLERVKGIPGVTSAAGISRPPLNSGGIQMPFLIEGRPAPPPSAAPGGGPQQQAQTADYFSITPNYFETMKIPVLRGRDITAQDRATGSLVMIINQTMARQLWPNEERLIELAGEGQRWFDVRRWSKQGIITLDNAFFSSIQTVSFQPKHIYFPIPNSEIDVNPNVPQNEGY
jgi:hypothetical protein